MSRPQYGNDMDRLTTGDIIRRARERAEAGLPREDYETFLRRRQEDEQQQQTRNRSPSTPEPPPRNRKRQGFPESSPPRRLQAPPGLHDEEGHIALPISGPAPVAQWPLAGPLTAPAASSDAEPYRPPAGASPPRRPPRPAQTLSILDSSKLQNHAPPFPYQQQAENRDSDSNSPSVPETPSTLSRLSTLSSVASIPDFPLPIHAPPPPPPMAPPRRGTLGPPPSARRGASSFYSHLSYVSPIPEESPRSRTHTSYASSAAMPDSWGASTPLASPQYAEVFYDETLTDPEGTASPPMSAQSMHYEDEGDESRLVRSASVGRRAKAALVTTMTSTASRDMQDSPPRPMARPLQPSPFAEGTGYVDSSGTSSNTVPSKNSGEGASGIPPNAQDIMFAFDTATALGPRGSRRMSNPVAVAEAEARHSSSFRHLSAIRRPPRLDINAVREAEVRGSLTSLPDLIRRATRLAASLDRGKRPASRFDMEDFPAEFGRAKNSKLKKSEAAGPGGEREGLVCDDPQWRATTDNECRRLLR